jgi:hypothetical protein
MSDFPVLDSTVVLLDAEAVHQLAQESGRLSVNANAKSDLARLAQDSDISVAQLAGRRPVVRWKVESLSVLLGCLPSALIAQGGTMSEPTTTPKRPFACSLCDKSFDRSQDLGVHKSKAHGILGPKSSLIRTAPKATGGGVSVKQPKPVPAAVQAIVDHVNDTHLDGPDVPCDEACEWAKEGYAAGMAPLPSGPALPARTDLRFELIDTRLRLISAVADAEGLPAPVRAFFANEIGRIRELLVAAEAGVA